MIVKVNNEDVYTERVYTRAELQVAIDEAETNRSEAEKMLDELSIKMEKVEETKTEAGTIIAKFEAALAEFPADIEQAGTIRLV